tara:strand:+ start:703 stop:1908 length:1206 start_codon:yes stop_codon:yes gene_type:complete
MESNLKIVEWNIDKLISAEYNPRKLSEEQKQKIKDSISRFGLVDPVIVNTNKERFGIIIGGHQRTKVSREMGFKKMPCVELDLNLDQEKELNVRLNKNTGEFDKELLVEYFDQDDLIDWGFDNEYFEDVVTEIDAPEEDDFNGELPTEPQTVLGDLYELNGHRVHCASSTEIDAVEKLMDGKKADMVFTDPPYGVSYQSNMREKSEKFEVLKNDDVFVTEWINNLHLCSKGFVFVWTSWKVLKQWIEFCDPIGDLSNIIIWDKGGGGIGDLKKTFSTDFEVALVYHRGAEIKGKRIGSVWSVGKDGANKYLHPTQKPVELSKMAIENIIEKNNVVLDLFLGSGSTLIGSEQTQRKCYGQELDPKYCDVIVKRWVKYMTDNDRKFTVKRNGEDITKETWINE